MVYNYRKRVGNIIKIFIINKPKKFYKGNIGNITLFKKDNSIN